MHAVRDGCEHAGDLPWRLVQPESSVYAARGAIFPHVQSFSVLSIALPVLNDLFDFDPSLHIYNDDS